MGVGDFVYEVMRQLRPFLADDGVVHFEMQVQGHFDMEHNPLVETYQLGDRDHTQRIIFDVKSKNFHGDEQ